MIDKNIHTKIDDSNMSINSPDNINILNEIIKDDILYSKGLIKEINTLSIVEKATITRKGNKIIILSLIGVIVFISLTLTSLLFTKLMGLKLSIFIYAIVYLSVLPILLFTIIYKGGYSQCTH
ncbi:MAG: hypothetical protein RR636_11720 [Clostridium sp.]|uniref:hypothetical protein n=1 Tax=Clostridium sp. TaxID=1506 RepID=UPI00302422B3